MINAYSACYVYPVTPSDTANLVRFGAIKCKGAAGDLVFIDDAGVAQTYPIALDELLPAAVRKVLATGTTATGLWCFAY